MGKMIVKSCVNLATCLLHPLLRILLRGIHATFDQVVLSVRVGGSEDMTRVALWPVEGPRPEQAGGHGAGGGGAYGSPNPRCYA